MKLSVFADVFPKVFLRPRYVAHFLIASFVILAIVVWTPNTALIETVLSSDADAGAKVKFMFSLFGALATNFTFLTAVVTVLVSLLFGINLALMIYYIRMMRGLEPKEVVEMRKELVKAGKIQEGKLYGKGLIGLLLGVLGAGCASCGSFLLIPIFGATVAGSFLAVLPLAGAEFGLVGIAIHLFTIRSFTLRIDNPY